MERSAKLAIGIGVVVATVVTTIFLGFAGLVALSRNDQTPANAAEAGGGNACTSQVYYFRYDSGTKGNNFGPNADKGTLAAATAELHRRRCIDPALTASHWATVGKIAFTAIDATTVRFAQNPSQWLSAIQTLEKIEAAGKPQLKTLSGSYWSLYMIKAPNGGVSVRQDFTLNGTAKVYAFKLNGREIYWQLFCGFQPRQQQSFPGIPRIGVPFKPGTPTSPPCSHNCGPPPGCKVKCKPPTCPPGQHGKPPVCKDDPSNDPAAKGNVPPQVTGKAPPVTSPAKPPAQPKPTAPYKPPSEPKPQPTQPRDPAPAPGTGAPAPTDPGTQGPCAPGIPSC